MVEFTPHQLTEIVLEVLYQRAVDVWERAYPTAQLAAMWGSKNTRPEDFIGNRPKK